jgi:hypothetical protein
VEDFHQFWALTLTLTACGGSSSLIGATTRPTGSTTATVVRRAGCGGRLAALAELRTPR